MTDSTETDLLGSPLKQRQTFKGGYAAQPGTGPHGETCKSCRHYFIKSMGSDYRKCWLMREHWTGGPGTDILASAPACAKWEGRAP